MTFDECEGGRQVTHYKGDRYVIVGVGHDSERPERRLIIYCSVDKKHLWVRPARRQDCLNPAEGAFCDDVLLAPGLAPVPRFSLA